MGSLIARKKRLLMLMQHQSSGIVNLCPAATGTEIIQLFTLVSGGNLRYTLTGLDPDQDYTLQATWTQGWARDSQKRLYLLGASTTTHIRPDENTSITEYITNKPAADGTLIISANRNGLVSNAEYAASMINIQLEIGSVPHSYVPYRGS